MLKLMDNTPFWISEESKQIHYEYIYREIFDILIYDYHLCPLPRRGVVLDIGANIGMFAFYAITKKNNYVYCFEPALNCLPALYKNLEPYQNRYHIIEKGIWSKIDTLNFLEYSDFSGCNQILELENNETHKIDTISIDEFVAEQRLGQVDFIKFDIEGAELEALKGATDTIKRFRPKIALSVYHKPQDEVELLEYIKSIQDYKTTIINHTYIGIKIAYCY